MSSNLELAEAYLEDAIYSLEEAKVAYNKGYYHRTVRRAQECIELCIKAILRLYGIEYPRAHEVSSMLIRIKEKLPMWFKEHLEFIIEASTSLAMQRGPSFYGDEYKRIPAKKLFKKEDAIKALSYAEKVLNLIQKLFEEWKII